MTRPIGAPARWPQRPATARARSAGSGAPSPSHPIGARRSSCPPIRLHRRKKKAVASIDDFRGLRAIEDNQALLETAAIETLAIDNSIGRNRALAGMAATGAKLIELGDLTERVAALEAAAKQSVPPRDPFDDE